MFAKPLIDYPLTNLMLAGIREVLLIPTPTDRPVFAHLLGNGSQWGISLTYEVQERPEGLAQAFLIGEEFIGDDPVTLILGDNFFYGRSLTGHLTEASILASGADLIEYFV